MTNSSQITFVKLMILPLANIKKKQNIKYYIIDAAEHTLNVEILKQELN